MQTSAAGTTVRVGNHALTPAEQEAGVPDRKPFVDPTGAPADPASVALGLAAPTGTRRTFGWPTTQPGDVGPVTKQATGRFYVDWTPSGAEDGVWSWFLEGKNTGGAGQSDQDVFYTKRPIVPP